VEDILPKERCGLGVSKPRPRGEVFHASPIQPDYIWAAGRLIGLAKDIGSHTFRHPYRSFLDDAVATVGVQ